MYVKSSFFANTSEYLNQSDMSLEVVGRGVKKICTILNLNT